MADRNWRIGLLAIIAGVMVAGCLPEVKAPQARAPAEGPPNAAPVISGSPNTIATVGTLWQFLPSVSDADGDSLTFSVTGLPGWLHLDPRSGLVSGTPAEGDAGRRSTIVVRVSDGTETTALPDFTVTVVLPANRTPTISGAPAVIATVGNLYRFRPSASDPDGDALAWSITGKPSEATFSAVTGELTWTPTTAGTWTNIVITVTDGKNAPVSLPAFSIAVMAPSGTGAASLNWAPPTHYADGSILQASELSAFHIYQGVSAATLIRIAEVDSNTTTFAIRELPTGTHYFAVTAVSVLGAESGLSAIGRKTIP